MSDIKINPGTNENANIIPKLPSCETCVFACAAMIPDPSVEWRVGMGAKPKVHGFRCHAVRPTTNTGAFPATAHGDYCVYHTDRKTGKQALRHLISDAVAKEGV